MTSGVDMIKIFTFDSSSFPSSTWVFIHGMEGHPIGRLCRLNELNRKWERGASILEVKKGKEVKYIVLLVRYMDFDFPTYIHNLTQNSRALHSFEVNWYSPVISGNKREYLGGYQCKAA